MIRLLKNTIHLLIAVIANVRYGFPSRKLIVIGVTGTDGKTTTTSMIYHILKYSGKKVAMITSVGAYIGDKVYDIGFHVTTPSSFAIQQYLKKAVANGNTHVVLEITSHGLNQNRAWGIHFTLGVLTNITHEHLDYHKTYLNYVKAKAKLLLSSDTAIINREDKSFVYIKPLLKHKRIISYALRGFHADFIWKQLNMTLPLLGDFNRSNATAAFVVAKEMGIDSRVIQKAMLRFTLPPGRQQILYNKEFLIMNDFAHTPNAISAILPELKQKTKGRLIHVFGSAGLRDVTKRPKMGKESSSVADVIILTSEDPRVESVKDINRAILRGIPSRFKRVEPDYLPKKHETHIVYQIADRKEAINKAVSLLEKGDTLVCTGKGHEGSMNYGNGEIEWNENEVIMEALEKRQILSELVI